MKILKVLISLLTVSLLLSCLSTPAPTVLEVVPWDELADQSIMKENDNRYVSVEVQFLGADALAMPSQMIYPAIANVILMNHIKVGDSYEEGVTTSLDSFLVGLPSGDSTDDLMVNSQFGDTIKIIGRTEFVNAGFGLFKHLLIRVESFENLGQ